MKLLRQAIESWDSDKKVAIVASGGLSHWVPIPKIDSEKQEDQGFNSHFEKWTTRN